MTNTNETRFVMNNTPKNINLLVDVAHLKVSANSLGLDYFGELEKLFQLADYVHLSDNDGYSDQNNGFNKNSSNLPRNGTNDV